MDEIPDLKLNSGGTIPAIGFGTWKLADGEETKDAVEAALNAGYRLIDTAMIYGNERSAGEAILESAVPRKDIFLTTKLWTGDLGYDSGLQAFEESLGRLGLKYVDLYLIHWPGDSDQARSEAWRALTKLQKDGLAKNIGVSNFKTHHLEEVISSGSVPAVNQVAFHPFIYEEQLPIVKMCRQNGIVVEAYSPLSRAYQFDDPVLNEIAGKTGKSVAQVMLRWSIQHGAVPIPKSAHPERIKENLDIFDFELSDEDMEKMNGLSGKVKAPEA